MYEIIHIDLYYYTSREMRRLSSIRMDVILVSHFNDLGMVLWLCNAGRRSAWAQVITNSVQSTICCGHINNKLYALTFLCVYLSNSLSIDRCIGAFNITWQVYNYMYSCRLNYKYTYYILYNCHIKNYLYIFYEIVHDIVLISSTLTCP